MVFSMLGTFGQLMDMKVRVLNLTAGDHVLQLNFSGVGVFISGESGTYLATLLAGTLIPGEAPAFMDTDTHTTGSYTFTDFEFGTLADLTVTVKNATSSEVIPNAELWLANETHRFLRQGQTNLTGIATFPTFEGDFVLVVGADGLQDEAVPITVSGDTNVDVSLLDEKASESDVRIQLSDWDTAALNFEGRMYGDNQSQ
ncbi:MAG: hypothetical protein GTO63_02880, partial [Anaerolineae bacterium]|nr:hypothetical protein [Anaerolineae bacterium]NIN93981.1 hypothetical protein [Anaerolineae bacterium]